MSWLKRWQLVQKMHQLFWSRWRIEYLTQLQEKSKWLNHEKQPEINDLVLIKDDNAPSNKWPMARIIKSHPGKDGLVRVVTLKAKSNILKRPITKICLLPKSEHFSNTRRNGIFMDTTNRKIFDCCTWDLQQYNLISSKEFINCIEFRNDEVVCSGPKQMFSATKRSCEFNIFSRKNQVGTCTSKKTSKYVVCIEIGTNRWFFLISNISVMTSICDDRLLRHKFRGCGILTLQSNCILKGDVNQISVSNEISNAGITLSPVPEVWNDNINQPTKFAHHESESNQFHFLNNTANLTKQIHILETTKLNYHDIHHYGIIYFWIICCICAFVFIMGRVKLPRMVPMPNLPPPENVA